MTMRVLIACDDDNMRKHIVALLSRTYQVVGTVTNAELLQAASGARPDVIVSAISTPRIDGLAARKKLIAHRIFIPFVFVSGGSHEEAINERYPAFISREEASMHLVNAVETVYNLAIYDSPFYPDSFDQPLEDSRILVIAEETLRKAERMILSCERCNSDAEIPFSEILDGLTGSDPSVSEYLLEKPGQCPRCFRAITDATFVEPYDHD